MAFNCFSPFHGTGAGLYSSGLGGVSLTAPGVELTALVERLRGCEAGAKATLKAAVAMFEAREEQVGLDCLQALPSRVVGI